MHIQRPPVSHNCTCGRRNILIFPDAEGALTWTCPCKVLQTIPFRPKDPHETYGLDVELRRKPIEHGCKCGKFDVIVLPECIGGDNTLRWGCGGTTRDENGVDVPCKETLTMKFNEKGGEMV